MNRRTIIFLCALIVLLSAVVAAGIWCLYADVSGAPSDAVVAEGGAVKRAEAGEEDVVKETAKEEGKSGGKEGVSEVSQSDIPVGPFKVKNCATGKTNLLRQNKDNSIELLDEKGKSQWKMPLGGRLCGMVGEVDYFNNGKIQYLFATGTEVHLVDRLGREVKGFPRTLPSPAVLGPEKMAVKGANYWRVDTQDGTLYLSLKKNEILTELPK